MTANQDIEAVNCAALLQIILRTDLIHSIVRSTLVDSSTMVGVFSAFKALWPPAIYGVYTGYVYIETYPSILSFEPQLLVKFAC